MIQRFDTSVPEQRTRGLNAATAALRRDQLVGLPLESAYGLAADAFSQRGIAAVRAAKGRADLAVPVMVPRVGTVSGIAVVDDSARALMQAFWPGPLTLILPAQPTLAWPITDPLGRVAVRMPLHPVALELLDRTGPLGVVSAASGPAISPDVFAGDQSTSLTVLLDAGRLEPDAASAVIDLTTAEPRLLRAGPLDPGELGQVCPRLQVARLPAPDQGT